MDDNLTAEKIRALRSRLKSDRLPATLKGIPIIESAHLTKTVSFERTLTWRERLFSWPWRPWVKTITEYAQVPSDEIFLINCDGVMMDVDPPNLFPGTPFPRKVTGSVKFIMHPATAAVLRKEFSDD
jgi:hypothetical protein